MGHPPQACPGAALPGMPLLRVTTLPAVQGPLGAKQPPPAAHARTQHRLTRQHEMSSLTGGEQRLSGFGTKAPVWHETAYRPENGGPEEVPKRAPQAQRLSKDAWDHRAGLSPSAHTRAHTVHVHANRTPHTPQPSCPAPRAWLCKTADDGRGQLASWRHLGAQPVNFSRLSFSICLKTGLRTQNPNKR